MDEQRSELEEEFLHGRCHLLAVALHELTGLPIGAYLDTDIESGGTVLVHAFVVEGDDGIDVRGRITVDDILDDEFDTFDPEFAMLSKESVFLLGHGRRSISQRNRNFMIAKRLAATIIERIDSPAVAPRDVSPTP
jgi:hypothetical protein